MGKLEARQFLNKLKRDAKLRKKAAKANEAIVRVGNKAGFNFSRKDLRDLLMDNFNIPKPADLADDDDTCFVFSETPGF